MEPILEPFVLLFSTNTPVFDYLSPFWTVLYTTFVYSSEVMHDVS